MTTRVRCVTAAAACAKSMLRETRCTSTKTLFAPVRSTTLPVTKKLCAGITTSSPGPTPSSSRASCIAAVAEVSVRTGRPAKRSESAFSKAATRGPVTIQRERSVSATAAIIDSSMVGRANGRKSMSGARHEEDADHDEADAEELLGRQRLAEEEVGCYFVYDGAHREERIGHAHGHARQAQDPHDHAHHVAGQARDHEGARGELEARGAEARQVERE